MTVMNHDDVSRGDATSESVCQPGRIRRAVPVEIPQAPAPADQREVGLSEPGIHLSASPTTVRSKRPARPATSETLDAIGSHGQGVGHLCGRHQHQRARVRVQGDRVAVVEDASDNGRGAFGQMSVDDEERGGRPLRVENIEQLRRRRRVRAVVERQVDRRGGHIGGHAPERGRRRHRVEQEGKGRHVRQRQQPEPRGNQQPEHRVSASLTARALTAIAVSTRAGALTGCLVEPAQPPRDTDASLAHADERRAMVDGQIRRRGIADPRVLTAMQAVPRHRFVPSHAVALAYEDSPLRIGYEQTISQPYIVAYMTETAALPDDATVLEIGTGSGYQAAVLAQIAGQVYTIEIVPELAARARALLAELGYNNVEVALGDGYGGWPEHAPFDAIVVTAAPDHVPPALVDQLAVGARLVLPVGPVGGRQAMTIVTKGADGATTEDTLPVRFVPMTGEAQSNRQ